MAARAGPGPRRERRGASLPEQSWGAAAARGSRSAGAARAGGPDLRGLLVLERAGPRVRAAGRFPGGGGTAARRGAVLRPPASASGAAPQQRGRAAGGRGGRRAAGAQSCGVAAPRRRAAGGRSLPRAFSRRGARRSLRLPKPIGESPGAHCPLLLGHFCGRKTSVWQTWCLRACSRFALGLLCFFGGTTGQEDCTSQRRFESGVQKQKKKKFLFFFFRTLSRSPLFIF